METKLRVADVIFQVVKKYVDCVFFVAGGGAMYLVDALRLSGIHGVACLHEQGAGYAALGYAMHRGLGVALVTSGPGSTNILTPLAAAWTDSIPLLVIAGQAKSTTLVGDTGLRTRGVQEIDIGRIVLPIVKHYETVLHYRGSYDYEGIVEASIRLAMSERPGPCWITVPMDVQGMEI
jgi:acetolactate synthase-1/2/3 large subunit